MGTRALPRRGEVTLWWAPLTAADPAWLGLLDPVEAHRYAGYRHPADRARFLVGAAIVRVLLGRDLGTAPALVPLERTCARCGRPHGKVRLAEHVRVPSRRPEVSVSHSGGWVVVAAGRDGPVGVDVEVVDASLDHVALARVGLGDRDVAALADLPEPDRAREFARRWVRMEAILKATSPALPEDSPQLQVHDVPVDERHRAAVAIVDAPRARVLERDARTILPPPGRAC
ncbi:4'-phosphopantetheinyl transferase superfamily protein [Occultella glacieicola]|uniref:4'-phosphopantetheinyl transferase superfamily protein n=1 Tax=Occultella glacieicola TaxID=2518684 RepID=A0ABY2E219_9MICO|nr:4'-phosphopantetheinyl transferase superfamily protein [Occultella glacieicola]TDE91620.1 4'-phosphopantetheinyl transferase superfamily protein [Occultella glacieicola]